MKKNTHPKYYKDSIAICACGQKFSIYSNKEQINIEICSNCHPFFTNSEKILDTAGRVEKFKKKLEKAKKQSSK